MRPEDYLVELKNALEEYRFGDVRSLTDKIDPTEFQDKQIKRTLSLIRRKRLFAELERVASRFALAGRGTHGVRRQWAQALLDQNLVLPALNALQALSPLDADPERIRAVAASGVSVVYGDASRCEVLVAAGLSRAQTIVVTYSALHSSMAILRHVRELRPELPVVVRTIDDTHIDALKAAGAAEVVPEVMEGSLMLASHALMLLGVPLSQVLKRIREVRETRYAMMRGFFRGASDADDELDQHAQPRLHTMLITQGAAAAGHSLEELALQELLVEVVAIRRQGIRGVDPQPDTEIRVGDVLVLRGAADGLAAAEFRVLQG